MALSNQQYESIMKRYEQTRLANRQTLEERQQTVYARIPAYRELERSVGSTALSRARALLDGDDSAMTAMHDFVEDIRRRKEALLTEAGFPADYLEPIYNCSKCRDTGYIDIPGQAKQKCSCLRDQEIALLYEQSNIREIISRENFSTLSYDYYEDEDLDRFRGAVKISRDFVQNFIQDYANLFFYGTVGTGKSFLSGCIANELLHAGHSVLYFGSSRLFELLATYTFGTKEKETLYNFYNDLYNCDLLIIDDLGTEMTNSFVSTQLFSCLNERQIGRKSTIISTNLNLAELRDRYSDRVFSRVTSNFTLCKLTGPDIRMKRKLSNVHMSE